ncbi:DExH-box splicing factor binding site-domain-containing protein [Limtongia smithiae]|uniref:DExH-box splicing factor binding site-domain-containing protein n=1 Tax=Limtongia smithiae TaxID=1125753 RepID=UPI0034CFEA1B
MTDIPTAATPSSKINASTAVDTAKKPAISFSFGGGAAANKAVSSKFSKKPLIAGSSSIKSFATTSKSAASTRLPGNTHKRRRSLSPVEMITGFDAASGAAIPINGKTTTQRELVIPAVKNKNWIEETLKRRRAGSLYKPLGQVIDAERNREADEQERRSKQTRQYGLNLVDRRSQVQQDNPDQTAATKPEDVAKDEPDSTTATTDVRPSRKSAKELKDDAVMRDILSEFKDDDNDKRSAEIVLSLPSTSRGLSAAATHMSEDEAYRQDIESRPDAPSLDAYESMPVEAFGFALLRGMGWKEGQTAEDKNQR